MERSDVMFDGPDTKLRAVEVLLGSFPVNDSNEPGIGMDGKAFFAIVFRHGISKKKGF